MDLSNLSTVELNKLNNEVQKELRSRSVRSVIRFVAANKNVRSYWLNQLDELVTNHPEDTRQIDECLEIIQSLFEITE